MELVDSARAARLGLRVDGDETTFTKVEEQGEAEVGGQVGARLSTRCALKGCRARWVDVGVGPKWRSEWAEMEEWGGGEPDTQS